MYKTRLNWIWLLISLSLIVNASSEKSTKQSAKASELPSASQTKEFKYSEPSGVDHGPQLTRPYNVDDKVGHKGFARGRVFEYSFSTSHKDPINPMVAAASDDGKEMSTSNGSNNFADHDLARQTLPRFFNYAETNSQTNENMSDPGTSMKHFNEMFKTPSIKMESNIQPANLGEVASASYFSYAPPSPPPLPSFMRMGFSDSDLDDDDNYGEDSSDGDLHFKPSSPKKSERSSDMSSKNDDHDDRDHDHNEDRHHHSNEHNLKDPKVKMVKMVMGRKNVKGKPWGTKTTLVYQDPKDANNYMQVTEIKMNLKSNKDSPGGNSGDESVSKVMGSSKSSFRGTRFNSQPSVAFNSDLFEPNEPQEPFF